MGLNVYEVWIIHTTAGSHIHGRLIILGEDVDVTKAVREMHSQKAEIIIVIKETRPIEIVTDSNILDKVDERRKTPIKYY